MNKGALWSAFILPNDSQSFSIFLHSSFEPESTPARPGTMPRARDRPVHMGSCLYEELFKNDLAHPVGVSAFWA
jgi:hypothetical protein